MVDTICHPVLAEEDVYLAVAGYVPVIFFVRIEDILRMSRGGIYS